MENNNIATMNIMADRKVSQKHPVALVLLTLLSGFLAWAAFFPLAKGVVISGTVVVDSLRKTIQHLEGGVIKAIHVSEGSLVKANDVLIELDNTKALSERDMVQGRYFTKLAEINRLRALLAGLQSINFDKTLLTTKNTHQVAELLNIQNNLFQALINENKGRKIIAKHRLQQLKEKRKGLKNYLKTNVYQINLLKKEVARLQSLLNKQLVDSAAVSDSLQRLSQQQGEWSQTAASIWETEEAINEASVSILQIETEWQQELSTQLSEAQATFEEMQSRLTDLQYVLNRTTITSPLAGVVIDLKTTTIGGVITSGHPIMDIVPQGDELVIDAHINPLDIDSIQVGMNAEVKLSSFRAKTMPGLQGIVESVSADALHNQTKDETYYLARIIIEKDELNKIKTIELVPGMPAEIFVNAGTRTLLQYLFDPISSIFRKGMLEE